MVNSSATDDGVIAERTISLPNRVVRAWLGGVGLAWDGMAALVGKPQEALRRGQEVEAQIESMVRGTLARIESAPSDAFAATVGAVRRRIRPAMEHAQGRLDASTAMAEEELERQVQGALDRLGIPSRERVLRLAREIDALTERIERELLVGSNQ